MANRIIKIFLLKMKCLYSSNCAIVSGKRMKLLVVSLVFVATITIARMQRYTAKPGSCPPALPVQFCGQSCYVDTHCSGIGKCCPTQCGGSICSMPVTTRPSQTGE